MSTKTTFVSIIALILTLFIIGCDSPTSEKSDLISALKEIVESDSAVVVEGINDSGAKESAYESMSELSKAVGDTFPLSYRLVKFGRKITSRPTLETEITLVDDSSATALVKTTTSGQFIVILRDTVNYTIADSVSKPFTEIAYQRLKLHKVSDTGDDKKDWRVTAFSPIISRTENCSIEITRLNLQDDSLAIELSNDSEDTLLNVFFDRSDIASLRPNGQYSVEIDVGNPNPFFYEPGELALVHYGATRGMMKFRHPLEDPENNGSFVGEIRLHGNRAPMCRVFFDVINLASIFDKNAPFEATYWAFPYHMQNKRWEFRRHFGQ